MKAYIFLILGWAIYFALHSILADTTVKQYFIRTLGRAYRYYRLVYVMLSTVGLFLLLVLNASIPSGYFIQPNSWTRYLSLMLATAGIFIVKAAFRQYNLRGFMGMDDDQHEEFKAGGILQHMRHPLYTATILITIGFWLFIPNETTLVSAACIFLYLGIGIPLEERKLIKRYGDAYRKYKKDVPAIFPRFYSRRS